MSNKIFYSVCFGFVSGVLWLSFLSFSFYTGFLIGIGCIFLILSFFLISKRNWGILVTIFVFAFFLGILRFHLAETTPPENFEKHLGQIISASGMIAEIPVEKENNLEITVETKDKPKTKILLFTKKDNAYHYGDGVNFSGKLEKPANFLTDQGNEFDYENYLKTDGILYTMKNPKIETVSH